MRKIVFFSLVLALTAASAAFAEDLFVQSSKAKVMQEPSFKSKLVAEVAKGQKFTVLGKQGSWVKVKSATAEGYVPALLLSPRPPMESVGLIKGGEGEIKDNVRRRASTMTSAAAARGLTAEGRKRAGAEESADYAALEKMESYSLSNDEVEKFMQGGKP
ncbi:MAG: SH3 domain-containing protein [Nitrospiraceae bacterium]|nr:SH3 domain-containing protein [Nitrospiraceae bacterium]